MSQPIAGTRITRTATEDSVPLPRVSIGLLGGIVFAKLLAHLLVAGNYGYFRDELYYLAAGRHLSFGYVDFPAFTAVLAALTTRLLGDSLVAIHIPPAIAGALLVLVTGLLARELGGGRLAQGLAGLATLVSTSFLATGSIFSMDVWDQLWWALAALVLVRLLRQDRPRLWLAFGLVAGLGLLTKLTFLAFGAAVVLGLLLTPGHHHLGGRWPWLGGTIAAAFLLPYVLWNAVNGWPTVEFWSRYSGKLVDSSPLDFLFQQIYTMNPLTLPLWLGGLWFFGVDREGSRYRALSLAYLVLLGLFALAGTKFYFLAPAYPMLYAGGARLAERLASRPVRRSLLSAYAGLLAVSGLVMAPIVMPVLPPATFGQMYGFLGADAGAAIERRTASVLPQWLADRFGWEEMVQTAAEVYNGLPANERAAACIYTANYGEAAAVDQFGTARGLPPAISSHNSYYLWGPGRCTGEVLITLGVPERDLSPMYASVVRAATVQCGYCRTEENDRPVLVARGPRVLMRQVWPQAKHYD